MKIIIFTSVYFLLSFSVCTSQWISQPIPQGINALFSIDFLNENTGVCCGFNRTPDGNRWGRVVYTTNSGTDWLPSTIPDSTYDLYTCSFINDQLCYIGGNYHDSSEGLPYVNGFLLKSTDGGRNWSTFSSFPQQFDWVSDMDFINENTGYVSAVDSWGYYRPISSILKTTDAGKSWTNQLTLDSLSHLYTIQCVTENVIFCVGGDGHAEQDFCGVILKSTNGGLNWDIQRYPYLAIIEGIFFTDEFNGVLLGRGDYGVIYRTTDQGEHWTGADSLSDTPYNFRGIDFYEGTGVGMVYGNHGLIPNDPIVLRTTNYGVTWISQDIASSTFLFGGVMLSPYTQFICGSGIIAEIFKTTNGGSTFINLSSSEIPDDFSLSQNYPNPFNPVTTIKYSVPIAQLVTIKIFNILGNETSTLVSEKQNAGTYTVDWNASQYPSGTYFYELTSGNFKESRRMILIK